MECHPIYQFISVDIERQQNRIEREFYSPRTDRE
jgi:hypothetical protein